MPLFLLFGSSNQNPDSQLYPSYQSKAKRRGKPNFSFSFSFFSLFLFSLTSRSVLIQSCSIRNALDLCCAERLLLVCYSLYYFYLFQVREQLVQLLCLPFSDISFPLLQLKLLFQLLSPPFASFLQPLNQLR